MPEEKTLTPEEIAQQRKEAEEKKIDTIQPATNLTTEVKALGKPDTVNMVEKAYESPISQLGLTIKGLEGRKNYIQQQDEVAQRRSRNMQMIAGLSDGLASLANLIGVADRGSNIDLGEGALTPLAKRAEAARLERKADIKSIDDRLDQAQTQLLQMKLARGNALAGAQAKEQERQDKLAAERRGYAFQEKMADKKIAADLTKTNATLTSKAYENALNRANAKEVARIRSGQSGSKKEPKKIILTNDEGGQDVYTLSSETYDAILRNFNEAMEKDVPMVEQDILNRSGEKIGTELVPDQSTPLGKAYAHYLDLSEDSDASDQEIENAYNRVISLSPTLKANVQRHGQHQSKWGQWAM